MASTEKSAMADDGASTLACGPEAVAHAAPDASRTVRHYPLDLPELPFSRYEHRRLGPRDILVHRIVSEFLFPTRVKPRVYDDKSSPLIGFGPIKSQDRTLGADLTVLRKMLVTASLEETRPVRPSNVKTARGPGEGPQGGHGSALVDRPATLEAVILDLVRRHYFEVDDPSLRLWLQTARPPLRTNGSLSESAAAAPPPTDADAETRRRGRAAAGSRAWAAANYNVCVRVYQWDEEKTWRIADTEHLRTLKAYKDTAQENLLFDGGAFLPALRHGVMADLGRSTRSQKLRQLHGPAVSWPEGEVPARFLLLPPRGIRHPKLRLASASATQDAQLDLASGRTGRGLDRDGIWATSGWAHDARAARRGRCHRRRATSEPPPGSFAYAIIPDRAKGLSRMKRQVGAIPFPQRDVAFPRMTLATLDRRSRRRSLSRTRIAEMFDWNSVVAADRRSPLVHPPTVPRPSTRACGSRAMEVLPREHVWPTFSDFYGADPPPAVLTADEVVTYTEKSRDPALHRTGRALQILAGRPVIPCANCCDHLHGTDRCLLPCGYCGAPNPFFGRKPSYDITVEVQDQVGHADEHQEPHVAPQCPVARQNRCKCTPFPTFHLASVCPVVCSRPCGNPHPAGSFQHRSAMTCKARCCMCGMRGHSGRQCKLRKCRCGGAHLGQDCGWNPTCRVAGCDRYLCGVHCDGCGGTEKPFVGWRCARCRPADDAGGVTADEAGEASEASTPTAPPKNKKKRTGKRKGRKPAGADKREQDMKEGVAEDKDDGPSWLPLKPKAVPTPRPKKRRGGR